MDMSLIVSIIVSIVAIVPGVLALVNQAKKDREEAKIEASKAVSDMTKAAQDAAIGMLAPLTQEVGRLQERIKDLEKILIDKTLEIGDLMQAGIEKDGKISILEFQLEEMRLRLQSFENKGRSKGNTQPIADIRSKMEENLKEVEIKKEEIKLYTEESIKQITNGSSITKMEE